MYKDKEKQKAWFRKWWKSEGGRAYRERKRTQINKNHKKYRLSVKGKKVSVSKARRMYEKYPEKWSARRKVQYAIKTRKLKKLPCEVCGNEKSQGHHEDYSKPLEVLWLCRTHHREKHGNMS